MTLELARSMESSVACVHSSLSTAFVAVTLGHLLILVFVDYISLPRAQNWLNGVRSLLGHGQLRTVATFIVIWPDARDLFIAWAIWQYDVHLVRCWMALLLNWVVTVKVSVVVPIGGFVRISWLQKAMNMFFRMYAKYLCGVGTRATSIEWDMVR